MNNTIRYIIAVPAGFLAAFIFTILSTYVYKYIFEYFLYFDILKQIAKIILQGYATYLLIVIPFDIAPAKKILFALLVFILNTFYLVFNYITYNDYNNNMLIGLAASLIALYMCYNKNKELNK